MKVTELALRAVLVLAGSFIVLTGVNVGFGGIETLGLQGSRTFLEITDSRAFHVQDSHVRFLGGLWGAVGIMFMAGAVRLHALRQTVLILCALIFVGGLARFTAMLPQVLLGPDLVGSLGAELLGTPLLAWWMQATRKGAA